MTIEFIKKYVYIPLSILIGILVIGLSSYSIFIKLVIVVAQIPINKYIFKFLFSSIEKEFVIMKLENLKYFSWNPKIEILINCYLTFLLYTYLFNIVLGNISSTFKIIDTPILFTLLIIGLLLCILHSLTGIKANVETLNDGTKLYLLSRHTNQKRYSILGTRIGFFTNGFVIDRYIFKNEDILDYQYNDRKNELTLELVGKRKIEITDKKAIPLFLKTLKIKA